MRRFGTGARDAPTLLARRERTNCSPGSTQVDFLSLWVAGEEGVAKDLVSPGLLLTLGTAEGVDGLTDADVEETDLVEHRLPACARQAPRDSAGPPADVA